jgi:hypothetical protein
MTRAALLCCLLLVACVQSDELRRADEAVTAFHAAMQRRAFGEIYATASPEMQAALAESAFLTFMQAVSAKLGAHLGSELKEHRIDPRASMTLVSLAYVTRFEKGPAAEKFVFKLAGDRVALVSYDIRSPLFD